ncbi:hypothetical protein TNCV_3949311 [Trichonephila clavipes]|nr:hypothetical protein TNCV_3949311 [Trichonephila clavipes]
MTSGHGRELLSRMIETRALNLVLVNTRHVEGLRHVKCVEVQSPVDVIWKMLALSSNDVVCERGVIFGFCSVRRFQNISLLLWGSEAGALFSISLHPASGGKGSLVGQKVAREVQGGPRNNFRDADAGCTCHDYFHKEASLQLGGGKRYTHHLTMVQNYEVHRQ